MKKQKSVAGTGIWGNIFTTVGHVLLTFLAAYMLPTFLFDAVPEIMGNATMQTFIDNTALHVLVFHLLGWYRGALKPSTDQKAFTRKLCLWTKIFSGVTCLLFIAFTNGVTINVCLVLDLALVCWAYFNGVVAGSYFFKAADVDVVE